MLEILSPGERTSKLLPSPASLLEVDASCSPACKPELLPAPLQQALLEAARCLRKHYAILDRDAADRAAHFFARALFPRRVGRPKRLDVTLALKWEAEGLSRKEIYRRLGKHTGAAQRLLCEAMRQRRLRRRQRRDRPRLGQAVTTNFTTITPTNVDTFLSPPSVE
jgi:hypothetical protein